MKKRIQYRIVGPLAAVIVLPAGARAQDDAFADFDEPVNPAALVELGESEKAIRQRQMELRREIEAIETASARRRAELEQRLSEAAQQQERLRQKSKALSPMPSTDLSGMSLLTAQPRWMIGVQVEPSSSSGVMVQQVLPDTPAARAGIQGGDKIEAVNGISVGGVSALNAIINAAGNQELSLRILRGDHRHETKVRPSQQRPQALTPPGEVAPGLRAFGGGGARGGGGRLFGSGVAESFPSSPAPKSGEQQWLEMRPRRAGGLGNRAGGPDTGEIQSLKGEIRELREIVQQLAASLGSDTAEAVEAEESEEEVEESEGGDEPDIGGATGDLEAAVEALDKVQN